MKTKSFAILACVALLSATSHATEKLSEKYLIGKAITHQNLTVYPVQSKKAVPDTSKFILFSQAAKKGLVSVNELGREGARVGEVLVANRAEKPLLIMGGEIILGGKQDRVVQTDVLIQPGKQSKVAVFCVEHGRWAGKTTQFAVSKSFADLNVRRLAQKGNQQRVWNEVAKKNVKLKTTSGTDTYRKAVQAGSVAKKVQPYVDSILKQLVSQKSTVGLVVAIDGKPIAIDIFYNAKLFDNVAKRLVTSYAMEAVSRDKPIAKTPPRADVDKFITNADQAAARNKKVRYKKGGSKYVDFEDDAVEGSSLNVESLPAPVRKTIYVK